VPREMVSEKLSAACWKKEPPSSGLYVYSLR
jgi:hypothetical protein